MSEKATETLDELELKKIELDSLIDIIKSINGNISEQDLYRTFMFTLRSYPHISKMTLYVLDEDTEVDASRNKWFNKESFGTVGNYREVLLPNEILKITKLSPTTEFNHLAPFNEFCFLIPIHHKDDVLAYLFLGRAYDNLLEEDLDLPFIQALSDIIIVAVENKKLARKQKIQEAFNRQLEIASEVQALLLPKHLPNEDKFSVVASYYPHHNVGGDYYDYIQINKNEFLLCVADVSGKGFPAAILMSNFQAALRTMARQTTDLKKIVEELNHLIIQNSGGGHFITAFFFLYNKRQKSAVYINAGHNAPFLLLNQHNVHRLEEGTTILGTFDKLPFLSVATINELDDFLIFCYTDGFTETAAENGEEFGEDKLLEGVKENFDHSHQELHERLFDKLHLFKGNNPYPDDITLLSCRVKR